MKENVFSDIQMFLKNPPVIIWGSGATVALGVPSSATVDFWDEWSKPKTVRGIEQAVEALRKQQK